MIGDRVPPGLTSGPVSCPAPDEASPARTTDPSQRGDTAIGIADAPAMPDRFHAEALLGRGGMGQVWRVFDEDLQRTVAMKVLRDPSRSDHAIARFIAEAQATAQLQHPGIVPVHDIGFLADGRMYYTMQEIRGTTLARAITMFHDGSDTWTLLRLVEVFREVCRVVGYAHALRVLHRDLKPSNVMLGEHGEVQVVDWGLVKLLDEEDPSTDREASAPARGSTSLDLPPLDTQLGAIVGTRGYMAPEQAAGRSDLLTAASDVYSLGAMLYTVLVGRAPHLGELSPQDQLQAAGTPSGLRALCLGAMADTPEDRPRDGTELANAVGDWLEGARATARERAAEAEAEAAWASMPAAALAGAREALLGLISEDRKAAPRPVGEVDAPVLRLLVERGLVVKLGRNAEPAHVADWPRLLGWVDADPTAHSLRVQRIQASRAWHGRGRPAHLLWHGASLAAAATAQPPPSQTERDFLAASAAADAARSNRRRLATAVLAGVVAAVLIVLGAAWQEVRGAEHVSRVSGLMAELHRTLRANDPHGALALALAVAALAPRGGLSEPELGSLAAAPRIRMLPTSPMLASMSWRSAQDLLLCSSDGVDVWDVSTGQRVRHTPLGVGALDDLRCAVDAAGRIAYAADHEVWVLAADGTPLESWPADAVSFLAWLPDGRLAVSSIDGGVQVLDPAGRQGPLTLPASGGWRRPVFPGPDGYYLAVAGEPLRVWDLRDGTLKLSAPSGGNIAIFLDNGRLLVGGYDGTLQRWHIGTGSREAVWQPHELAIFGLELGADATEVWSWAGDGRPQLSDVAAGRVSGALPPHPGKTAGVAVASDGARVSAVSREGALTVWDAERHETLATVQLARAKDVRASPDGQWIAVSSVGGEVTLVELPDRPRGSIEACAGPRSGPVLRGGDASWVAVPGADGWCLQDLRGAGRAVRLPLAPGGMPLASSRHGDRLLVHDAAGARVLDTATLQVHHQLSDDPTPPRAGGFTGPDDDVFLIQADVGQRWGATSAWRAPIGPGGVIPHAPGAGFLLLESGVGPLQLVDLTTGQPAGELPRRIVRHSWASNATEPRGRGDLQVERLDNETVAVHRLGDASAPQVIHIANSDAGVRLSPDGRLLGGSNNRSVVSVVEVETGAERYRRTVPWHLRALDFTPSGHNLVLRHDDGVEVLDTTVGAVVLHLDSAGDVAGVVDEGVAVFGTHRTTVWDIPVPVRPEDRGDISNLRACRDGRVVPVLPYPPASQIWASEADCR
ncbi:MAG: WD40 repeat protein [Myxococcota bacterium]